MFFFKFQLFITKFQLLKNPKTYQEHIRDTQEPKTKDSKIHVLVIKNEILPLHNHVSIVFQIYLKFTHLSKKIRYKNWIQVQQNASHLHVESLDHLGDGLSAVRAGIQILEQQFYLNGNLVLHPMLKYLMNFHIKYHYGLAYRISRK